MLGSMLGKILLLFVLGFFFDCLCGWSFWVFYGVDF